MLIHALVATLLVIGASADDGANGQRIEGLPITLVRSSKKLPNEPSENHFQRALAILEAQNTVINEVARNLRATTELMATKAKSSFNQQKTSNYIRLFQKLYGQISQEVTQLEAITAGGLGDNPIVHQRERIFNRVKDLEHEYSSLKHLMSTFTSDVQFLSDNLKKIRAENESLRTAAIGIISQKQKVMDLMADLPNFFQRVSEINDIIEGQRR